MMPSVRIDCFNWRVDEMGLVRRRGMKGNAIGLRLDG